MFKSPVTHFVLKALAIFVGWYIIYELWLLPDGRLDEWISLNIVGVSSGIIQSLGYETWSVNRIIGIGENGGIELVDGCTGISAIGLFLGFILAYPGDWKNRISFCLLGIGVIYIVNILRIVVLVITQEEWIEFFDITHDYSTTTIFYIVIFLLWMTWVKFSDGDFTTSQNQRNAQPV
jgi:exosortase family protein XrtF